MRSLARDVARSRCCINIIPRLALAWLALWSLSGADASDEAARCLRLARGALRGAPLPSLDPAPRLDAALRRFDGVWLGSWDGVPTRHVWRTLAPGLQFVHIEERGGTLRGVDIASGDVLCGIVIELDGSERVHVGRLAPGERGIDDGLAWRSGGRTYLERVGGPRGGRRYRIVELLGTGRALHLGEVAEYAELPEGAELTADAAPR